MLKAKVIFKNSGKQYDYFTKIENLKENDFVVVQTKHGYEVAKFVRYIDKSKKAKLSIIQKIKE